MDKKQVRVIISGGGTGGHVFPAIAIAKALRKISPDIDILFVGAIGKMEMEQVPKAGFPIEGLWISGIQRRLTLKNLLFPLKVIWSSWRAWTIIRRFKPDVAVGVGGYASWPILEIASRRNIPALIQEQNSYAGITNRVLSKKVQKICVAYPNMEKYFPPEKILETGNPIRQDLLVPPQASKAEAYQHFNLNQNLKTIFIFGGSLGAKTINEAVAANKALIESMGDKVQILWQVGKIYWETFQHSEVAELEQVEPRKFVYRMDLAYLIADVVVCRAGALTISEIAALGKAAILVPSPNVAEDHQTKNAMALVNTEAALLVQNSNANSEMLPKAFNLIQDKPLSEKLSKNIKALAKPEADFTIANAILELTKK